MFLFAAGHLEGTEQGWDIEQHLARCEERCGEYLSASLHAIRAVVASAGESPRGAPPPRQSFSEMLQQGRQREEDAKRLLEGTPSTWLPLLSQHPEQAEAAFLACVADRAVYLADERPQDVVAFAGRVRASLAELPAGDQRQRTEALLWLAEGFAKRTMGDHLGALEAYESAEKALRSPAYAPELPRIDLARGASFRRLNRYDEAREAIEKAREGFSRLGLSGEAKALWQLASIAYEAGDHRQAFRLGHRAHKLLLAEGNEAEAAIMRQLLAVELLGLGRPRPARRILEELAHNPHIERSPYEKARLLWNQAHLASVEGDPERSRELLARCAERFSALGAPLDAARSLLDLSELAAHLGDLTGQASAAASAATILEQLPGQAHELAVALEELRQALQSGAAVAGAVSALRDRIRSA